MRHSVASTFDFGKTLFEGNDHLDWKIAGRSDEHWLSPLTTERGNSWYCFGSSTKFRSVAAILYCTRYTILRWKGVAYIILQLTCHTDAPCCMLHGYWNLRGNPLILRMLGTLPFVSTFALLPHFGLKPSSACCVITFTLRSWKCVEHWWICICRTPLNTVYVIYAKRTRRNLSGWRIHPWAPRIPELKVFELSAMKYCSVLMRSPSAPALPLREIWITQRPVFSKSITNNVKFHYAKPENFASRCLEQRCTSPFLKDAVQTTITCESMNTGISKSTFNFGLCCTCVYVLHYRWMSINKE